MVKKKRKKPLKEGMQQVKYWKHLFKGMRLNFSASAYYLMWTKGKKRQDRKETRLKERQKKISSAAYLRGVNTLIFIGLLFTLLVVSGENHTEISGSITVGDFGLSFPEFGS